jgi:hypothetical protein
MAALYKQESIRRKINTLLVLYNLNSSKCEREKIQQKSIKPPPPYFPNHIISLPPLSSNAFLRFVRIDLYLIASEIAATQLKLRKTSNLPVDFISETFP